MLAARVTGPGTTRWDIQTVPVPRPTGNQALIKVAAAGLCHTDTMIMEFSMFGVYPVTGSHEPAGTVVALGVDAQEKGQLRVGQRIAGLQHFGMCHTCKDCLEYSWKYCTHSRYTGLTADGAFAEYVLLEADCCVPIPDSMPFEQAAPLTCAGVTMWTALRSLNLQPGQVVGISGLGALGHLGVQFAKAMGLKVVGVDARPYPIELARDLRFAPDLLINASETSPAEARKAILDMRGPEYLPFAEPFNGVDGECPLAFRSQKMAHPATATILTADPAAAQQYGVEITRRHGTFVVVAQPETVSFSFRDFVFRDLTVIGSLQGDVRDLEETIAVAAEHGIVSDVSSYTLAEHEALLATVHDEKRKGKAVMVF
ncbi:hypothetical protein JCM24511_07390 [Saitozyma sp. JCM 24511]|nr:hypothetical protein JCM24511_07390 [Saitozyma sp. JCM 24511]